MKIVIDSNVFISSFFYGGNPRKVFDRVTNGLDDLYISDEILIEIASVMSRPKFDVTKQKIEEYIKIIEYFSLKIIPQKIIETIVRDKADHIIIQCAYESNAKFIVTGDNDLLVLKEYENIQIVNPKQYLDIIG